MNASIPSTRSEITPATVLNGLITVIGLGLVLWVLYYAYGYASMPRTQHANMILGGGLAIYYFNTARAFLAEEGAPDTLLPTRVHVASLVVIGVAALAATGFAHLNYWRWLQEGRIGQYSTVDLVVGGIIIYTVTDATFRKYGRTLGMVVVVGIVYGLVGGDLPGVLAHSGLSVEALIARETIALQGVYGVLLKIGATWIAIFVIMAGVIEDHGGFDYIMMLGKKVATRSRSGIAQSAVITSMFIGSMMGGAAANVATTGSFTIPMMKENGIPARFAAAAESMASTGGQILPPIMSLAAFLMADFTGTSYAMIAVGGVIPAVLFYATVAVSIHLVVVKHGWGVELDEELAEFDSARDMWLQTAQYSVPLLILIYYLMVLQYPPMLVGLYTVAGFLAVRGLVKLLEREFVDYLIDTVDGFRTGAVNLAPYMGLLGSLGIVIDIVQFSGLANKIAVWVVLFAGGAILLVLLLTMVVSLLFGLGMPTPAAYIVVALILAPALEQIGLPTLVAHFYVFYFAVFSAITPPVAIAVAVGSGIAGTDFLSAAKETLRLGAPVFLIPFMFVRNSEILYWSFPVTAIKAPVLLVGILALIGVVIGYSGTRELSKIERAIALGLFGVIAFAPQLSMQVLGAGIFVAFVVFDRRGLTPARLAGGTQDLD